MKQSLSPASLTPSCHRILQRFLALAAQDKHAEVGHLALAVLLEESLGGTCLKKLGLDINRISSGCFGQQIAGIALSLTIEKQQSNPSKSDLQMFDKPLHDTISAVMQIGWVTSVYERAMFLARRSADATATSSEHLVLAMAETPGAARTELAELGIHADEIRQELFPPNQVTSAMPVDFELQIDAETRPASDDIGTTEKLHRQPFSMSHTSHVKRLYALLDANLNRSREGLRVLEDFARFVLRSPESSERLKHLRHDLVSAEHLLHNILPELLSARNINADVGTSITTQSELRRDSLNDVVTANARRVQESLRSLEEFGKTISSEFATSIKQLRYQAYALEKGLRLNVPAETSIKEHPNAALKKRRLHKLATSRLYVLLTESSCQLPWKQTAEQILLGGADVIQLREKFLSDEELVRRGLWLADACKAAGALFIMNDRCDLAMAARADGVHIGQNDGTLATTREQVGEAVTVGVSTHSVPQFTQACHQGADYLGVGPVFASKTKNFDSFPGLQLVKEISKVADRPWFAIGGINQDNLEQVNRAGASRIAVCGAVLGVSDPERAVRCLLQTL